MQPEEIDRLRAEDRRKGLTDLQAIELAYSDEAIILTKKQEQIRARLEQARALLYEGEPSADVIDKLVALFEISNTQAWRDVKAAEILFGKVDKASKEGRRAVLRTTIQRARKKANEEGEWDAVSKMDANLIKLDAMEKADAELPDFGKLQPSIYVIVVDDRLSRLLDKAFSKSGTVDADKILPNVKIEDADFTEL